MEQEVLDILKAMKVNTLMLHPVGENMDRPATLINYNVANPKYSLTEYQFNLLVKALNSKEKSKSNILNIVKEKRVVIWHFEDKYMTCRDYNKMVDDRRKLTPKQFDTIKDWVMGAQKYAFYYTKPCQNWLI